MIDLNAMTLEKFPVTGLTHVRDLINFDGPLLSLFRHPNGESYLYYWCDCDETSNRWMVLRVSETTLLQLTKRLIPLSDAIPSGSRDDYLYFLDVANDGSTKSYLAMPTNIPDSYKPVAGTVLEPQAYTEDHHSYSFLIQGDWSADRFGDFPKTFNKVYSLLYGMNVLRTEDYISHPWRGGFSSMHFFKEIMSEVPPADRPLVSSIQKSSPGFIKFSLHTRTAEEVVRCVADFKNNEWAIKDAANILRQYIRRHGLNDLNADFPDWKFFDIRLILMVQRLLSHLQTIDENQFIKICQRPFEAAKIALTLINYIQDLTNFERRGLVNFSNSPDSASGPGLGIL